MKTEYKKVSDLLALNDEEVLQEFEMVELKGGKIIRGLTDTNNGCNTSQLCGANCPVILNQAEKCGIPPINLDALYICNPYFICS